MNAPIRHPVILTDAQFEDMTRKGAFVQVGRVELRGGVVVAMSPVHINHASVMMFFIRAFDRALAAGGSPLAILSEISIRFGGGFQPTADLVVYDPSLIPADYDGPMPAEAVKLVVEVADASLSDDIGQKQIDYSAAGLAEYWVADVRGRVVHCFHTPRAEGFAARETFRFGETVSAETLPVQIITEGV